MTNFNTLGNGLKRGIIGFSKKISVGYSKPMQRFIADMVYGIIASGSCKLTDISRALKEDITLKKTIDRLGRNLGNFTARDALTSNYLAAVRPSLGADTMLLVDGGDVTKPCSKKMEAIGSVFDASTRTYGDGYWTMGVAALTENTSQPIPIYEKLYPCKKQGGHGFTVETEAALQYLRENFSADIPRIFDRGFDSGDLIQGLVGNGEKFILRQNQNRVVVHKGKRSKIDAVVRGLECQYELSFKSRTGNKSTCKIGMTEVVLPNLNHLKIQLVVCKEFGENPLVLYTNLCENTESVAVRIVKAYLMRWRIEEYYAFKKEQGMQFEDFRVRSLDKIQNLDLLLTIAIGYIGILCEKVNEELYVMELISASKRIQKTDAFIKKTKFIYYAVHNGITYVLGYLKRGINNYFNPQISSRQLCIYGFEKMG